MTKLIRTDSSDLALRSLVKLLDADLAVRDGDEHSFYAAFNKVDTIRHVVVASVDAIPVGCGAFKEYDTDTVEIKRMYVKPEYRGQGIALEVLKELEVWAAECGYTKCVLETGKKQPEAIALYTRSGYSIIPNYGQYQGVENSLCMRKAI